MKRILAVDDDHIILALIQRVLPMNGFEVNTFLKAEDGLRSLEKTKYDLILSDLSMPEMDGETFFLQAKILQPGIPFIFITANDNLETAVRVMKMGADEYLQKPFKGDDLISGINIVIEEKKHEQLIRKTMDDDLIDKSDKQGIFSWKQLYGNKDTEQTNRIMGVLSRNMEHGGGFMWLDMLKNAIEEQDADFDDLIIDRSILNLVVESAGYIRKIITDLNYISTFDKEPFHTEKIGLGDFLLELKDFYDRDLVPIVVNHQKKISLNLIKPENYTIEIHKERIFKILRELLCNAVKYSPDESKILFILNFNEVGAMRTLEISLWNSPRETMTKNEKGESIIGIPYEYSESVFEMFNTLEGFPVQIPEEEWSQGTGLYIVRKMIEKMGGGIDARNIVMHTPQNAVPYVKVSISLLLD